MKEKDYVVSLKIEKEIEINVKGKNSDDALKKMEDIILKGDYEKLFTKENTRNYVIANKVKPKPLFCKKRGFVLLKK